MMRILFTLLFFAGTSCYAQFASPPERAVEATPVDVSVPDTAAQRAALQQEVEELDQVLSGKALSRSNRVNALLRRGYAKISQDDKAGAKADYEAVLRLDSAEENAYHNLGLIYAKHKDCNAAKAIAELGLKHCAKKREPLPADCQLYE